MNIKSEDFMLELKDNGLLDDMKSKIDSGEKVYTIDKKNLKVLANTFNSNGARVSYGPYFVREFTQMLRSVITEGRMLTRGQESGEVSYGKNSVTLDSCAVLYISKFYETNW